MVGLLHVHKDEVADIDGVLVTKAAMDQIGRGGALTELESVFFVTPHVVEMGATDAERKATKSLSKGTSSTITVRDLICGRGCQCRVCLQPAVAFLIETSSLPQKLCSGNDESRIGVSTMH
jgi:hypothetical protein